MLQYPHYTVTMTGRFALAGSALMITVGFVIGRYL